MLVIVANSLPPAVRGLLKAWFIEPKPNVFVTDLSQKMEENILEFLEPYFTDESGMVVIASDKRTLQGFTIHQIATPKRRLKTLSGLQLIEEKVQDTAIPPNH